MDSIKYYFLVFAILIGINVSAFAIESQTEEDASANSKQELNTFQEQPKEINIEKDGSVMMLVPAGAYWMGLRVGTTHHDAPLHKVFIDAFYMDKCEVTNRQYRKFVEETGHREPYYFNDPRFNDPMFPVVGVNWYDAVAYAEWAGKRLPTEAEWEKAARGGLESHLYPWGNELSKEYANYHSMTSKPVASYNHNGYGLFDMAGNVWEWVSDHYSANYYNMTPLSNPKGPTRGLRRVQRGGCLNTSWQALRCGNRHSYDPDLAMYFIGFRCVKEIE